MKGIRALSHVGLSLACSAVLLVLASCSPPPGDLEQIRERGSLTILTLNSPTTWYIGRDDVPRGPEYDMATAFARSLGVKAHFKVRDSVTDLLHALAAGEGDMIAAGMTRTPMREKRFDFGPDYQQVRQQVVCRRNGPRPDSVDELVGLDLRVVGDSSYVDRLRTLRADHPDLAWHADPKASSEQLLRAVWRGEVDCTVADSNIVAINRRYFPNLVVAFELSKPQPLAWIIPQGATDLRSSMQQWQQGWRHEGKLKHLMTRYYGHARVFDYVDTRTYVRRIENVFPRYRKLFRQAADQHNLPPVILAAQAYQESHWNPRARSPTGVRGMMMLTRVTAAELGVDNRLNPAESIDGGARYLAKLEQRLPDSIEDEDRIWFALAAYNVGFGHVRDARTLATRLGHNPDHWSDMARVLPLLGQRRYYRDLRHGYARGAEPVRYIERIRNYADILRHKMEHEQTLVAGNP